MASLGVNIDHIANVREARKTIEPDPVTMALLAELGGADGITILLRKKFFKAISCVATIANRLHNGSTPRHIFFSL